MTHKEKLIDAHKLNSDGLNFEEWLILESERNHNKQVLMAGDLGQAFSRIGDLEKLVKNNVDLANVRLSLPNDEEIDSYADEWEEKNNTKEYPIECRDLDEVAYILGVGARWVCSRVNGNKA